MEDTFIFKVASIKETVPWFTRDTNVIQMLWSVRQSTANSFDDSFRFREMFGIIYKQPHLKTGSVLVVWRMLITLIWGNLQT